MFCVFPFYNLSLPFVLFTIRLFFFSFPVHNITKWLRRGELSVCLSMCVCVSVSVYVSVCMSDMGDKYCNVFNIIHWSKLIVQIFCSIYVLRHIFAYIASRYPSPFKYYFYVLSHPTHMAPVPRTSETVHKPRPTIPELKQPRGKSFPHGFHLSTLS